MGLSWRILVGRSAQMHLQAIKDQRIQRRILKALHDLEHDPETKGKPLGGTLAGYYSIRAVSQRYRIIYKIEVASSQVYIVAIGLRKEGERLDIYALAEKIIRSGLLTLLVV